MRFLYYRIWTLPVLLDIAQVVSKVIVLIYIPTNREGAFSQILAKLDIVAFLFLTNFKVRKQHLVIVLCYCNYATDLLL